MSIKPDHEAVRLQQEQAFNYYAADLSDRVQAAREKAADLGMFAANVLFTVEKPHSEELRIAGKPFKFKNTQFEEPLLLVTVNHLVHPDKRKRPTLAYTEEMVLSMGAVGIELDFIQFTSTELNTPHAVTQAPVIWETKDGGWRVFRGKQGYKRPQLPTGSDRLERLKLQNAQIESLVDILHGLSPGCEESREVK